MVAADDDGGLYRAAGHQFVEAQSGQVALAIPQPADARRETLEVDALLSHANPAPQVGVVGEQLQDRLIRHADILRVAAEGHPAERPLALAEQRPDVGGHEAGVAEGVAHAGVERPLAQVVAVVEDDGTAPLELDHRRALAGHRGQ